ncbi:hypothetical protein Tco_0402447, partial [Tanacetum coccineum]
MNNETKRTPLAAIIPPDAPLVVQIPTQHTPLWCKTNPTHPAGGVCGGGGEAVVVQQPRERERERERAAWGYDDDGNVGAAVVW